MLEASVIAPVSVLEIWVLLAGSFLAAMAQFATLIVTSTKRTRAENHVSWYVANMAIGGLSGFIFGSVFLSIQQGPVSFSLVVSIQAIAGILGLDLLKKSGEKLLEGFFGVLRYLVVSREGDKE